MMLADPDHPKLTKNDKIVLTKLTTQSRIADSKIASDMNLSPQAVFKIRNKLEKLGIIEGYTPIINYSKLGINSILVIIIHLKPIVWSNFSDDVVTDKIANIPHLISAYRIPNPQASHILVMGFKDIQQKEYYLTQIQTKYADEIEIKNIYSFSSDKLITLNSYRIMHEMIQDKETYHDLFSFLKTDSSNK
ncbi:MAG: hypothetical protein ACP5N2_05960 [Candidatus Nanoarchaeia archaeon]